MADGVKWAGRFVDVSPWVQLDVSFLYPRFRSCLSESSAICWFITSSLSLSHTRSRGKEALLWARLIIQCVLKWLPSGERLCGLLEVRLCRVLRRVCGPVCCFYEGTACLPVWSSISQRDIYGFASAVPCEWCNVRPLCKKKKIKTIRWCRI